MKLLTGHCTLRRPIQIIGLSGNAVYRNCGEKDESSCKVSWICTVGAKIYQLVLNQTDSGSSNEDMALLKDPTKNRYVQWAQ
jgi:hypothetical protein